MSAAIREATTAADVALARGLFVEYAQWLAVDLCFQGFAEELASLPGAYARPVGRLLLAGPPGEAFGCIALRPLAAVEDAAGSGGSPRPDIGAGPAVGEVKRLFVRPAQRNGGWGCRLAEALIDEARAIGYRELKLDTLVRMSDARKLYAKLGFRECAPYYANPLPDVVYMARSL